MSTNNDDKTHVGPAPSSSTTETRDGAPLDPPARNATTRRLLIAIVLVVAAVLAFAFRAPLVAWFTGGAPNASATRDARAHDDDGIDHWTCTMHPFVHADGPGKCPICGMDLVPVTKTQMREGLVTIDDAHRQMIGVKTARVVEAPMHATLRAAGRVAFDEAKLADVSVRASGFVTKLVVNETGRRVHKGETLALVYSPDVYAAERDFLVAAKTPGGLVDAGAARTRLRLLGVNDDEIDALAKEGKPRESIAVTSPVDGVVIEKNAVQGASVDAGARLFRIGAVDDLWIEANLYQSDLLHLKPGDKARIVVDGDGNRALEGSVATIAPSLDESSRTGRARFHVKSAKTTRLLPGMFVTVELERDLGPRLQIPKDAVVYTGPRRLVFVDLGGGQFKPQEIVVGDESDGMLSVTSGLRAGDVIATSGVFLIAAEARINTTATFWNDDTTLTPPETSPKTPPTPPTPTTTTTTTTSSPSTPRASRASSAPAHEKQETYWCPMHHEVRSEAPGTCPKCGMTLVPIPHDALDGDVDGGAR